MNFHEKPRNPYVGGGVLNISVTPTVFYKRRRSGTGELRGFYRKVDNNILLSTIYGIFHVLLFQYVVWFIKFATEPAGDGTARRGTRTA